MKNIKLFEEFINEGNIKQTLADKGFKGKKPIPYNKIKPGMEAWYCNINMDSCYPVLVKELGTMEELAGYDRIGVWEDSMEEHADKPALGCITIIPDRAGKGRTIVRNTLLIFDETGNHESSYRGSVHDTNHIEQNLEFYKIPSIKKAMQMKAK